MTTPDTGNDDSSGFWNRFGVLLLERFSSPLISTFVISWCVTNYKVLLIVLGKGDLDDKLGKLDYYFTGPVFQFPANWWIYGIPLVMTFFYIFVYPEINIRVMRIVDNNDAKLKAQQEIHRYKKVVDQLRTENAGLAKLVQDSEGELTEARLLLSARDRQIEELEKAYSGLIKPKKNDLTTFEQDILTTLFSYYDDHRPIPLRDLQTIMYGSGTKVLEFNKALKSLKDKGMIDLTGSDDGSMVAILVAGTDAMGLLSTVKV